MSFLSDYKYYILGGIAFIVILLAAYLSYLLFSNGSNPSPNSSVPGGVTFISWTYEPTKEGFIIYE